MAAHPVRLKSMNDSLSEEKVQKVRTECLNVEVSFRHAIKTIKNIPIINRFNTKNVV
jgi:hypothetical protein